MTRLPPRNPIDSSRERHLLVCMVKSSVDQPDYEYIAYIDEAGDPGLNRVRPIDDAGGTEWMVIGAALVRKNNELMPPKWVGDILNDIGIRQRPDLHFRDLSPTRQIRVCAMMANLPAVYFVVASNKKNMRGYKNERVEAKSYSQQWFYNWLCRILLERITDFALRDSRKHHGSAKKVKFEFSHRGGHRYSQTKAYHWLLKTQARVDQTFLKKRVPKWEVMDYRLIEVYQHRERAGLQLADAVASAFYTAIDNLDTGPCFQAPAEALKTRIAFEHGSGGEKLLRDYGLVLQPTPDFEVAISEDQRAIFRTYGFDFEKKW